MDKILTPVMKRTNNLVMVILDSVIKSCVLREVLWKKKAITRRKNRSKRFYLLNFEPPKDKGEPQQWHLEGGKGS